MKKIALYLVLLISLLSCGGNSGDTVIAPPTTLRTDLLFGYYGGNAQEANPHTNLVFASGLQGQEAQLNNIEFSKQPTILDVDYCVYIRPKGSDRVVVNPNAENLLRARFNEMKARDLLKYVIGLYPIDEPNNTVVEANVIADANKIIRKVASEFPELGGVKLVAIYSRGYHFPAIETFDWVGFDHYENTSGIFVNGEYDNLLKAMKPWQRTIIMPGGAIGNQDITPFLNFAETHNEVVAIVAFIWWDEWEKGSKGIRSNGMARSYCQAGMQIKYPNNLNKLNECPP